MENPSEIDLLRQQIEHLERRWRWSRRIAGVILAGGLLSLVGWVQNEGQQGQKEITVERLTVGKPDGYSILLEAGPDAARIAVRDPKQRTRSLLELTDAGVISRLADRNGRGRFDLLVTDRQIGALDENEARLRMANSDGEDAVLLLATDIAQGVVVIDPHGPNKKLSVDFREKPDVNGEPDANTPSESDIP